MEEGEGGHHIEMGNHVGARRALVALSICVGMSVGCGPTIYIPGEAADATGGQGAGPSASNGTGATGEGASQPGSSTASSSSSGSGGEGGSDVNQACLASECKGANDGTSCNCSKCNNHVKISCEPETNLQGLTQLTCTCTLEGQFSGVCFEHHPENMCDLHLGCCFLYFQGGE